MTMEFEESLVEYCVTYIFSTEQCNCHSVNVHMGSPLAGLSVESQNNVSNSYFHPDVSVFDTQFTYTFIVYMAVHKFICLVEAKST